MRNISLLTLYETRKSSLSFGCPLLDEVIGGISRGIVTELCGEAGSGKTQICLKLSIQVRNFYFYLFIFVYFILLLGSITSRIRWFRWKSNIFIMW